MIQPKQRTIQDRHDYLNVGKSRGMNDPTGFALVVDEVGRIRLCQTSLNINNPALECEYQHDGVTGRPVACMNIDVSKKNKRELGWILLVDLYEEEDDDAERWETVWQLYANTHRRSPVPHVPDEWLPEEVLNRRAGAKPKKAAAANIANLGPAPKKKRRSKPQTETPKEL